MPYGMSKKIGGDTPAIDAVMERCVSDVMGQGHSKQSAIRICKVSITVSRTKKQKGKR